ncbi:MAG: tRNA (adenosine(37)-N6)-dimethylallyltransferase MiaA [Candidatus Cloacimonetes bacterium]|nr:tRNA (adenosine(37)-N6)-dimethylallyltransferase MiaA [Candidatus Cloacimonadota bacterium]
MADTNNHLPKLIIIQGPTASGKSDIALKLAETFETEIISADSRQIYKYMNIGTAKPDNNELERIRHHLIDIVEPDQPYNAGRFVQDADAIISDMQKCDQVPIIAGGTGFYIKALLEGIFEMPEIDISVRMGYQKILEEQGSQFLHGELAKIDPESADRIHPNDSQRITRALEVWKSTGITLTQHWLKQKRTEKYQFVNILINPQREYLYDKINLRVDLMIKNGLLDEIRNLLEMGYKWSDPGMNSVGYLEFREYFEKKSELQECIDKAKQNSRNYAKRQITWYRKQKFDLTINSNCINFLEIINSINKEQINLKHILFKKNNGVEMFIARINDYEIMREELDEELMHVMSKLHLLEVNKECYNKAVNQLIDGYLLLCAARKSNLNVSSEEIEDKLIEVMVNYDSKQEFEIMLKERELTLDSMKQRIADQIIVKKFIQEECNTNLDVPEEKLSEIYRENGELFRVKDKIRAYHILFRADQENPLQQAEKLKQILKTPEDFIHFVVHPSHEGCNCIASDLGYFEKGHMVEEFEQAAFNLEVNEISDPVKTAFGYHLILVTEKREAHVIPYDLAKECLVKRLNKIESEMKLLKLLKKLRIDADILINEDYFEKFVNC